MGKVQTEPYRETYMGCSVVLETRWLRVPIEDGLNGTGV
jgi:hypothetical protein